MADEPMRVRVITSTLCDDEPTAWTMEEGQPGVFRYAYFPLERIDPEPAREAEPSA